MDLGYRRPCPETHSPGSEMMTGPISVGLWVTFYFILRFGARAGLAYICQLNGCSLRNRRWTDSGVPGLMWRLTLPSGPPQNTDTSDGLVFELLLTGRVCCPWVALGLPGSHLHLTYKEKTQRDKVIGPPPQRRLGMEPKLQTGNPGSSSPRGLWGWTPTGGPSSHRFAEGASHSSFKVRKKNPAEPT